MVIEGRKGKHEKNKVEKYEKSSEAVPPSTRVILSDPHLSELLNLILERDKNSIDQQARELQTKLLDLASGKKVELTDQDFDIIESYRQKIKEVMDKPKEVLDLLTPERIKIIASSSNDFAKLVGQLGVENTKKFLEGYLSRLIIVDYEGFSELESKLEAIKEAEIKLKEINNELKNLAKAYNIPEKELGEVLAIEDQADEALRELIKSNLSTLGKIRNWLGEKGLIGGRKFVEERLGNLNKISDIDTKLLEIDTQLQEIGNMIANAVFGTEKGIGWLTEALVQTKIQRPGEMSFVGAGGFLREDKLRSGFEGFLAAELTKEEKDKGWNSLDSDRKGELKKKYLDKIRASRRGGIIEILFQMMEQVLDQIKPNV